jgi:hypothetical protein
MATGTRLDYGRSMGRLREWLLPPPLSGEELAARAAAARQRAGTNIPRINVQYPQTACFCGCGRPLGFGDKGVAKQGARVLACLEYLRSYTLPIQEAANFDESALREFIAEGERFAGELADVIHGDLPANVVDRQRLNYWLRTCQGLERELGKLLIRADRT